MEKSFHEAFGLSFSYANQSQIIQAIPMFKTTIHEKCFLAFKFFQNFFMASVFLSVFSTQLISPQIKLVTDHEISLVKGFSPGPITNFGIGEPCIIELKQGKFLNCLIGTHEFDDCLHSILKTIYFYLNLKKNSFKVYIHVGDVF